MPLPSQTVFQFPKEFEIAYNFCSIELKVQLKFGIMTELLDKKLVCKQNTTMTLSANFWSFKGIS